MDAPISGSNFSNPYDPCSLENVTFPAVLITNHSDWEALKTVEVDAARRYQPIFPNIEMNILNLFPEKFYKMKLKIEKVDNWLYKKSPKGIWYQHQYDEVWQPVYRPRGIMHPDGNRTGEYWMSKTISFGMIGVTNVLDTIRREEIKESLQQRQMFLVQHRHKYRIVLGVNNGMGVDAFQTQDCANPFFEFFAVSERREDFKKKLKALQQMKGNGEASRETNKRTNCVKKVEKLQKSRKNGEGSEMTNTCMERVKRQSHRTKKSGDESEKRSIDP